MDRIEFEENIDQYLSGRLDRDKIDDIWVEMVQDPDRLEYFKHVANTKEAVRELEEERKAVVRNSGTARYVKYAVAAAIALVIGVLAVMRWNVEPAAVEPVETIELNYYRSETGDVTNNPTQVNKVINRAITMANSGETKKAIDLLRQKRTEMKEPSDRALLNLNIGSLQYNNGAFDSAITSFKKVIEQEQHIDVLTLEKAFWFLGNSYFQKGQMVEARKAIEQAYDLNGAYRRVASTYLNALADK